MPPGACKIRTRRSTEEIGAWRGGRGGLLGHCQHQALRSTVDFRGSGYMWLKISTLQEVFPGNLRNISTEGDNLGEGTFSCISRCEAEPRKQGWTFTGTLQGADTVTPVKVKVFHRSFLHYAVTGDSPIVLPEVALIFSKKQLRDFGLSLSSSLGTALWTTPSILRLIPAPPSYFWTPEHHSHWPAPPIRGFPAFRRDVTSPGEDSARRLICC